MTAKQVNELVAQSIVPERRRDIVVDIGAWAFILVFVTAAGNFVYTIATQLPG